MEKEHKLEFYHVPGEYNNANMVTRDVFLSTVDDIMSEEWTQGCCQRKNQEELPEVKSTAFSN